MIRGTRQRRVGVALAALMTAGLVSPALAAAPVNDDFADALPISEGVELRFDNREATTEAGEVVCDAGPTGYWEFSAPAAGDYVAYATGSNVDTEIGWSESLTSSTGDCPDDADESYDAVETPMTLASGEKEYVQLGFNSADVRGTSGVGVARIFPGDDAFADRSALTFRSGAPTAVRGISFAGTEGVEGNEPGACGSSALDQTVWLTFTPPTTEAWYIEAKSTGQVNIAVYSGTSLSGLTQLGCSTGARNAVVVELMAGTAYAIQVDNVNGSPKTSVVRAEAAGKIRSLPVVVDRDGDGTSTNVGNTSAVALLADNRPAIAYFDTTNGELRYAERSASGTWSDLLIDADGDGTSIAVGSEVDLAILDDGRPAVAYWDGVNKELRYAERSAGGVWSDVLIDDDGDGTSTNVGRQLSLLVLPSGRPAVAYYDVSNSELRYAERSAGGVWSDVLVDADGDGASTNVGKYIDMILYNGEPVIAYADSNDQQRLAVPSGSGWTDTLIRGVSLLTDGESANGADGQPSLAVGPDGKLHIAIQDDDNGHTTYGTMSSGGAWTFEDILTDRLLAELGWGTSVELNFDRDGKPVVLWADSNYAGHIGASVRSSEGWSEQVTTPYLLDPRDPSSDGSVEMFNSQMDSLVFPDGRIGFAAHDSVNGGLYWVEDTYRVCPTAPTPFTDVSATSFAKDDIPCIFGLDVTTGTTATTYSPDDFVTREQMAAFLARLYRETTGEACSGGTTPFTDVSATSFAKDDIPCIFGLGITTGTTATTYSPDDFVTREQMAAFLARLYRKVTDPACAGGTATPFTDISATSFAKDDIPCIFGLGITTGTTATTYSPDDFVTREQMAAFLGRLWRTPAVLA
jgi:S-layer homology domain